MAIGMSMSCPLWNDSNSDRVSIDTSHWIRNLPFDRIDASLAMKRQLRPLT